MDRLLDGFAVGPFSDLVLPGFIKFFGARDRFEI
jgi:hypothetical protein